MKQSIFVHDGNGKLLEMEETKFETEDMFQQLLEDYPQLLVGNQIDESNPRKWIFISREMGVPAKDNGANQWSLDHLFIDQDAIPTFVEVKRSTDTRIRREVVGQMLDYAANGIKFWGIEQIKEKYALNGKPSLAEIGIEPEEEDAYWTAVEANLRSGKLRLLFVADEIPETLQSIIEFLNNQMVHTEVLGLEIKQFTSAGNVKTFVPRILGKTYESATVKNQREKRKWDEESFLGEIEVKYGEEERNLQQIIINKCKEWGLSFYWGTGKDNGSYIPIYIGKDGKTKHQLFAVYTDGSLEIYFQHFKEPHNSEKIQDTFRNKLNEIKGIDIGKERLFKRPSFKWSILKNEKKREKFLSLYFEFIQEIKEYEESTAK